MAAGSHPVHYLFLRREGPPREGDPPDWPTTITRMGSDDVMCVAVQLAAAADGWHAEPLQRVPPTAEIPEDALVLTRDTELGLLLGRSDDAVAFLGARVEMVAPKEPGRLTHVVVQPHTSGLARRPRRPVVVPATALVLSNYAERQGRTEASLDLRFGASDLADMTPWLPDETIEALAARALDGAVLSIRARHLITLEVEAGRVSLHGRAELASSAEAAVSALQATPGVVDVVDHLLIDESLQDLVEQALAAKGITNVRALAEHGLISLHGETEDPKTRRQAEDIAARVTGVRGVVNRIVVRAPA
jgi:hypothetical protein